MANLRKVLLDLYASEINVNISCFWDAGWVIKLGDEMNGYRAEASVTSAEGLADTIIDMAKSQWPNSSFAKIYDEHPVKKDDDGYAVEAALDCGFTMIDDDGDVFGCTTAQLLDFAHRAVDTGRRRALREVPNAKSN